MAALAITVIASLNAISLWAVDYDDIYYNSSSKSKTSTKDNNGQTEYETAKYYQEERDVDEYNRRYTSYDSDYESGYYYDNEADSISSDDEDFEYTERIRRFHNPTVILESEDEEAVELYEDTRTDVNIIITTPYRYGWWGWYYDPWLWDDYYYYTDLWYYPWYRSYWYNPSWRSWGCGWTWGHHHHHHHYANVGWIGGHHHNGHGGYNVTSHTGSGTRGSGVRSSHAGGTSRYTSLGGSRSAELAGRHNANGSGYSRSSSASRSSSSAGTRSSSGYSGSRGNSGGSRSSGGISGGGSRGGGGGSHSGGSRGGGGRR